MKPENKREEESPETTTSAALTLRINELRQYSQNTSTQRDKVTILLGLEINISLVFLRLFGRLQELGRVLRIPGFPSKTADPYVVCEGKPRADTNESAVSVNCQCKCKTRLLSALVWKTHLGSSSF